MPVPRVHSCLQKEELSNHPGQDWPSLALVSGKAGAMSPSPTSPCSPPWGELPPSHPTNCFVNWVLNLHQEGEERQTG